MTDITDANQWGRHRTENRTKREAPSGDERSTMSLVSSLPSSHPDTIYPKGLFRPYVCVYE